MAVTIRITGSFRKTERALQKMQRMDFLKRLDTYAQEGVRALRANTPKDSGLAASSWGVKVSGGKGGARIVWTNNDTESGFPVAIMLQYGHGTGTGGYVQGRDYINPAMRPVFDRIADKVWKEVTSA